MIFSAQYKKCQMHKITENTVLFSMQSRRAACIESKTVGEQSRSQSLFELPHIKFCSAARGFMKLGLGDIVSEVPGARVSDSWAFNAQLRLDNIAEVLIVERTNSSPWDVVAVILKV